jgi:hypothetical protein
MVALETADPRRKVAVRRRHESQQSGDKRCPGLWTGSTAARGGTEVSNDLGQSCWDLRRDSGSVRGVGTRAGGTSAPMVGNALWKVTLNAGLGR